MLRSTFLLETLQIITGESFLIFTYFILACVIFMFSLAAGKLETYCLQIIVFSFRIISRGISAIQ